MSEVFNVVVQAEDGTHLIATEHSYEAAQKEAKDWLGDNATWQGLYRAISRFGAVLTIEVCTEEEYHSAEDGYGDADIELMEDDEWEQEMKMEQMMLHGPEAGDCW